MSETPMDDITDCNLKSCDTTSQIINDTLFQAVEYGGNDYDDCPTEVFI